MAQDMNVTPRRSPRWVKIALGVSLALNLAVAGVIAGAVLREKPKGPRPGVGGYATPYIKALPREDRRAILSEVRKSGAHGRLNGKQRRALYADMLTALRAPDLDQTAIMTVLNKQKAASLGVQSGVQEQWLARITAMSLQDRLAYADAVEKVLSRKGGPHKARKH